MFKKLFLSAFLSLSVGSLHAEAIDDAYKNVKEALGQAGSLNYAENCPNCIKEVKPGSAKALREKVLSELRSEANDQTIKLSVISEDEVNEYFNEMASNQSIPFGYAYDGCYARAHKMSRLLEDKGVITGKAFVEGNLNVVSPVLGNVNWWYHVAPVVLVKKDGKEIPYVIDPSLFKKPVPFSEWRDYMTAGKKENVNSEYFTNRFSYSPSDKFPPPKTSFSEPVMESMQSTMAEYKKMYTQIVKSKVNKGKFND